MPEIYLDHAASAPLLPAARDALIAALASGPGNASSSHAAGRRQRRLLSEAREAVADLIGAQPSEIVFTSGCTEGNVLAIRGALAAADVGRDTVTGTRAAHPATAKLLEGLVARGRSVHWLAVNAEGRAVVPAPDDRVSALDAATAIVTTPAADSVTGACQPVAEIAAAARRAGATVHVDAAQLVGRAPLRWDELDADLLTFSAHKFGGPQGIGALVVRGDARWVHPDLVGSQELGRRPGTEAVALAAAFGAAAREVARDVDRWPARAAEHLAPLDQFIAQWPGAERWTPLCDHLADVRLVAFVRCPGEAVVAALDARGIAVSTGTACTSGARTPPQVLIDAGRDRHVAARAVRVSVGRTTSDDDVHRLVDALSDTLPLVAAAALESEKT